MKRQEFSVSEYVGDIPTETLCVLVPGFDLGDAEGDACDLADAALEADEQAAHELEASTW